LLLYSVRDPNIKYFDNALKQSLRNFGCVKTDTISHGQAYLLFGKKGASSANEIVSSLNNQVIEISDSIKLNLTEGQISTDKIGPSKEWKSMDWRSHSLEPNSNDVISSKIIGITSSGSEALLKVVPKDSAMINLSFINANTFPYIRLEADVKDTVLRTAPQINKWQVLYTGVPEGSLNPSRYYTFYKDTVQEGDVIKFGTTFENVSDQNMDSLLVRSWVYDKNRVKHIIYDKKRKPLLAAGNINHNDSINTTFSFDTKGFAGSNSIWLELNPDNNQKEQYHFNNLAAIPFYVKKDISNPLLDVTFDGIHILNGDIVSSKPEILIRMNDDNKYLAINDTSMFKIWLLPPGQTVLDNNQLFFKNASFNGNSLRFTPAALPSNNAAEVQYKPTFIADGTYTLVVEGVDASKNASGKIKYRLNFEVVTKSTITEVMNYPNPFSTSTKFVFTLTGSEIPTDFKIQIMTITSKVVREISIAELGPIHIGRNITEYAWDGKDEFGDQLANGVYVYRIVSSLKGSSIEKRETGADKYFVKGYGKIYLLR
jgi:flagellar hook assembly protein FlgD